MVYGFMLRARVLVAESLARNQNCKGRVDRRVLGLMPDARYATTAKRGPE